MSNGTFDFKTCFNQAWETYKKNLLLLVGASLVASLLMSVTLGILAGPLMAGLMILILKLMDGDSSAAFEDIFSQFNTFATTFLLCLGWGVAFYVGMMILMIIPVIGQLAAVLLSVIMTVFLTFAILLAAQKKLGFGSASRAALEMIKKDFWPLTGYTLVATILSGIGAIACGIGAIFTMPLLYLMLAAAYRSLSSEAIDVVAEEIPPTPEPAPEEPEPLAAEPVTEEPVIEEPPPAEEPEEPKSE